MSAATPVLLSLDTATDRIHAALSIGDDVRVCDLPGGAQASATLLPTLLNLLQDAGRVWADVDAIAFGSGPGAFTGLRTACSVAQGLALALSRPVIALDTLMAVAEDARQAAPQNCPPGQMLWVLQDARMDELYVSAFQWDGHAWLVCEPARLWPLSEPAQRWLTDDGQMLDKGLRWAGNAGAAYPALMQGIRAAEAQVHCPTGASAQGQAHIPLDAQALGPAAPRGAALAALARAAWVRGDILDAALALPRYVRDKVAQTTAERAAQRQVGA